ncbi:Werner syndrome ATP-dependent helicase [Leucoagaricus sp. SymC.cos]|nr:Werner syndrome ATP-dependent helicase [Leucoagaricus sp. SymC.cos]
MAEPADIHGSLSPISPVPAQPDTNSAPEPTVPYSWREWHPNVQIFYIRDHHRANQALARLTNGPYGFDLEWKPNFRKGQAENPVALVQLANHEFILLLQITAMREFPLGLAEFLLNPHFIKVGVGIQGDAKKLYQDWGSNVKNCVDLALLARTVDNNRWKGRYTDPLGLARLVSVYEDRALMKGKITRSNWERVLTEPQQIYAANDAHAGFVIYTRLMAMLPSVSPQPEAKCYTFDTFGGQLCVPSGRTPWKAQNPEYDAGPPPPPKQPKKPKPPMSTKNATAVTSQSSQFLVDSGSGNAPSLPAPQSIPGSRKFIPHRGNYRFRGNSTPSPQRWAQPRPFQAPSQHGSWQSRKPLNNTTHHFVAPTTTPPILFQQQPHIPEVRMVPAPSISFPATHLQAPQDPRSQESQENNGI